MARRRVPSFDDRLRRTPRVLSASVSGGVLTVTFKDRMDVRRTECVFRTFTEAEGVLEFSTATWTDELTLTAPMTASIGPFSGSPFVKYMVGNLRNRSRFELLNATRCDRISVQGDDVVTGAIMAYGGTSAPTGYLLCDGSAVSRTTYAALFTAIGTSYGIGNGTTTFNLPDLRGRAVIGAGTGTGLTTRTVGTKLGEEAHLLTELEMPAHSHGIYEPGSSGTDDGIVVDGSGWANDGHVMKIGEVAGSGFSHNNMQPSQVCTYIIKT